jgi:hypothetical protein
VQQDNTVEVQECKLDDMFLNLGYQIHNSFQFNFSYSGINDDGIFEDDVGVNPRNDWVVRQVRPCTSNICEYCNFLGYARDVIIIQLSHFEKRVFKRSRTQDE